VEQPVESNPESVLALTGLRSTLPVAEAPPAGIAVPGSKGEEETAVALLGLFRAARESSPQPQSTSGAVTPNDQPAGKTSQQAAAECKGIQEAV